MKTEQVVVIGALAMLMASAGLGAAGAESGGPAGAALGVHASAGSLGWIALGGLAVALGMLRSDSSEGTSEGRAGIWLAWLAVAALAALVGAGAIGSAAASAGAATAALLVVAAFISWLVGLSQRTRAEWTVPRLGAAAALALLTTGLFLGALAAWMAVGGDAAAAASLTTAQSAVTAVPLVMLLATAAVEWQSNGAGPVTTAGLVQVGLFVLAAVATIAGVLSSNLAITEADTSLVLGGIAIFGVRLGPKLLAADWARGSRIWPAASALALAVDAGLFVHVVVEVGAQRYASAGQVPSWLVFAIDHVTFAGVGTTALLGAIAMRSGQPARWPMVDGLAAAGLTLGLVGVTLGLGIGSAVLEDTSATLLGLSVLAAVATAALRVLLPHGLTAGGKTMPVP